MQATKFTTPTGVFVLVCDRANEESFSCEIKHVSSTQLQPFIAVNHDAAGKAIGGSTISESIFAALKARSLKAGLTVEQIEI